MALLLASIAGFGSIIGIFVRFIRGYNRISPYIAFFALLAVGLTAEMRLPARRKRPQKAHPRYGGAAGLRLLGAAGPFQPEI